MRKRAAPRGEAGAGAGAQRRRRRRQQGRLGPSRRARLLSEHPNATQSRRVLAARVRASLLQARPPEPRRHARPCCLPRAASRGSQPVPPSSTACPPLTAPLARPRLRNRIAPGPRAAFEVGGFSAQGPAPEGSPCAATGFHVRKGFVLLHGFVLHEENVNQNAETQ